MEPDLGRAPAGHVREDAIEDAVAEALAYVVALVFGAVRLGRTGCTIGLG